MVASHGLIAIIILLQVTFIVGKPPTYEESVQRCRSDTYEIWNCLARVAMNRYLIVILVSQTYVQGGQATAELLFWNQREALHNVMSHPVFNVTHLISNILNSAKSRPARFQGTLDKLKIKSMTWKPEVSRKNRKQIVCKFAPYRVCYHYMNGRLRIIKGPQPTNTQRIYWVSAFKFYKMRKIAKKVFNKQ